jgi:hypothetical protein
MEAKIKFTLGELSALLQGNTQNIELHKKQAFKFIADLRSDIELHLKPDFATIFRKLIVVLATVVFYLRDGEIKSKSDLSFGPLFGLLVYLECVNWVFRSFNS